MNRYIEREPLLTTAKELQGDPFGAPLIVRAIENAPAANIVNEILGILEDLKLTYCFNDEFTKATAIRYAMHLIEEKFLEDKDES